MAFNTFTVLYNHHLYLVPKHFYHIFIKKKKQRPKPLSICSLSSPSRERDKLFPKNLLKIDTDPAKCRRPVLQSYWLIGNNSVRQTLAPIY